jgi:isopentenyl diphosphate isomerase/L-lactate dehydrogenase-like FMN-dependent dehydrogenase
VRATELPFILKGILSEQDDQKALEAGVAAIVVSHHGGNVLIMLYHLLKYYRVLSRIFLGSGLTCWGIDLIL